MPNACDRCGTRLGVGMLACPKCGRLVHSDLLTGLADQAAAQEARGEKVPAIQSWRQALALLPPQAGQRQLIEGNIERLEGKTVDDPNADREAIEKRSGAWKKWLGGLAPAAAFLFTKGKFLILGLTKLPTLASMLVFLAYYWETWGWAFALGFVLTIYIHEMGHAIALRHYGIPASAPLFIPGFGAVIFAKTRVDKPIEDAHVGLAGPAAGLAAVLVCLLLYVATSSQLFLALAILAAYMNLFNLIPVLFLDGSRGLRGLDRNQRWMIAALAAICSLAFASKLSLGIGFVLAGRLLFWKDREQPYHADRTSFAAFAALLVILSGITAIPAPDVKPSRAATIASSLQQSGTPGIY